MGVQSARVRLTRRGRLVVLGLFLAFVPTGVAVTPPAGRAAEPPGGERVAVVQPG